MNRTHGCQRVKINFKVVANVFVCKNSAPIHCQQSTRFYNNLRKLSRMLSETVVRSSVDNVSEIVDKTRVLVDRLRCAVIHQDNLTKDCFDSNATELSKTVESIRNSYLKLEEEYLGVKEEISAGEKRLNSIVADHKKILEENARLKDVENGFLNSKTVADEHGKIAKELRNMLRAYKLLTGVRFDFNDSTDILTGYVAVSGNKPSNSTLIPFEIDTKISSHHKLLWNKINEACLEISQG